jgi:hypothetical protein
MTLPSEFDANADQRHPFRHKALATGGDSAPQCDAAGSFRPRPRGWRYSRRVDMDRLDALKGLTPRVGRRIPTLGDSDRAA